MSSGGLTPRPLQPESGLNWVFLVELLVCGILSVFFLFYFNRLFATLVSYGIRAYTWHRFRAYIDIQSLQISLLGGRVFFKNVRYHAHNETILVHSGFITWNYWYRKVQDAVVFEKPCPPEDAASPAHTPDEKSPDVDRMEGGGATPPKSLPVRITVEISGLEVFLYNRSPGYDLVVENYLRAANRSHDTPVDADETAYPLGPGEMMRNVLHKARPHRDEEELPSPDEKASPQTPSLPAFLRLLPVYVDCNKGAVVLGNESTPHIVTLKFSRGFGTIDAGSAGPLDVYQQLFRATIDRPVVQMRPNTDFKNSQLATAVAIKREKVDPVMVAEAAPCRSWFPDVNRLRRWRWFSFLNRSTSSVVDHTDTNPSHAPPPKLPVPDPERWLGLSRYLEDVRENEHDEWDPVEYAKASTLADCPRMTLSFHWDVPGPVPRLQDMIESTHAAPPAYGMELGIHGGTLCYGPWSDRQRVIFQNIFFPPLFVDAPSPPTLRPGDTRIYPEFNLLLTIEEETTLRIPMREQSKDWKWKGRSTSIRHKPTKEGQSRNRKWSTKRKTDKRGGGSGPRPYAWVDVKVPKDSSVKYRMDMYPRELGYTNNLRLDLGRCEVYSSVNHGMLMKTGRLTVDGDLANPASWNALREWTFAITATDLDLFILRDHFFLLTDLSADWSSGPPSDYHTFVPYRYRIALEIRNPKLYLNSNDANIVNDPSDFEDNDFLILGGTDLTAEILIPLDRYLPVNNEITFDAIGHGFSLEACLPPRNTIHSFVQDHTVARLGDLSLLGSYCYWMSSSTDKTDRLTMDITGTKFGLHLYGFLARQLVRIKDNYFGDFLHFRTMEEFQSRPNREPVAHEVAPELQPVRGADLDVILSICVQDANLILPKYLYDADAGIVVEMEFANIDLRFTSYYMDMSADFSPLNFSSGSALSKEAASGPTELFLDCTTLWGHRLFGLPNAEPTYDCIWDVRLGQLLGEISGAFLDNLLHGLQAFAFGFEDEENSSPMADPFLLHDATFLHVRTELIRVWLRVDPDALLMEVAPSTVELNDLCDLLFSQRVSVQVPSVTLACVDTSHLHRQRHSVDQSDSRTTFGYLRTGVSVHVMERCAKFLDQRDAQQHHILQHDCRTNRIPFLIAPDTSHHLEVEGLKAKVDGPASIYPPIPSPVQDDLDIHSSMASVAGRNPNRLSTCGESQSSSSSASIALSIRRHGRRTPRPRTQADTPDHGRPNTPHRTEASPYRPVQTKDPSVHQESAISSFAFSTPLAAPRFPLDGVFAETLDIPSVPPQREPTRGEGNVIITNADDVIRRRGDDDSASVTVVVTLNPGVQIGFTSRTLDTVLRIMHAVQCQDAESLLDSWQIRSMSRIVSQRKRRLRPASSMDMRVVVAHGALRFAHDRIRPEVHAEPVRDEVELRFSRLTVSARERHAPETSRDPFFLHATLDHAKLGVTTVSRSGVTQLCDLQCEDALAWLTSIASWNATISVREAGLALQGAHLPTLVLAVDEIVGVVDAFTIQADSITSGELRRLQDVVHRLTEERPSDPVFMARPSYMLRSLAEHLRNHSSWKVVSRLRHIYRASGSPLYVRKGDTPMPPDVILRDIMAWEQWKAWELPEVQRTRAMQVLQGATPEPSESSAPRATALSFRCGLFNTSVDTGPTESAVVLRDLSLACNHSPESEPTGLLVIPTSPEQPMVIQVGADALDIRLQWSLLHHAEGLLNLDLGRSGKQRDEGTSAPATSTPLHVVAMINSTSVNLESRHLTLSNVFDGVCCSFIQSSFPQGGNSNMNNLVLHANRNLCTLSSPQRTLMTLASSLPTVTIAFCQPDGEATQRWIVNGTSDHIGLDVEEHVPGVLETVDQVLCNEAADVMKLVKLHKLSTPDVPSPSDTTTFPDLRLSLSLKSYRANIRLLPSLNYGISGSTMQLWIQPIRTPKPGLDIHLDVDRHMHDLDSVGPESSVAIARFTLPQVNGRLSVQRRHGRIFLLANAICEKLVLDASALHGVMLILQKPEVMRTIEAAQADVRTIQRTVAELFPPAPVVKEPTPRQFGFDCQLWLQGLLINTVAPSSHGLAEEAHLTFGLGAVLLDVREGTRWHARQETSLDFHFKVKRVFADLALTKSGQLTPVGNATLACEVRSAQRNAPVDERLYQLESDRIDVNVSADTASTLADVLNHLHKRLRELDLSREKEYLRRLRHRRHADPSPGHQRETGSDPSPAAAIFASPFHVLVRNIQIVWLVEPSKPAVGGNEDLVVSVERIELSSRSRSAARLAINDLQLQLVPPSQLHRTQRSSNSALLPEMVFNVFYASSSEQNWKLNFQAAGKSLDLRLDSKFIRPLNAVQQSMSLAVQRFRSAAKDWTVSSPTGATQAPSLFQTKKLSSLVVDADFAGAVVHLTTGAAPAKPKSSLLSAATSAGEPLTSTTVLRSPGIALKVEFKEDPTSSTLDGELKVSASSNTVYPGLVPLVREISDAVKDVVWDSGSADASMSSSRFFEDETLLKADPKTLLGRTKLNFGVRICRQDFQLNCHPFAQVQTAASFDQIYILASRVTSSEYGDFFCLTAKVENLAAAITHQYSRASTFRFNVESVTLSLMNSKYLSGVAGISAILKVNPIHTQVNARQLQDFLIFRDIWMPTATASQPDVHPVSEQGEYLVQRYQQVATATAFPWNATVAIEEVTADVDLGQGIGKCVFSLSNLWASSRKSSNWKQELCVAFETVAATGSGRTSGFVRLNALRLRTSIAWPLHATTQRQTPLIHASVGFDRLQAKAAFDYQVFAIADVCAFDFIMFNTRDPTPGASDRLVAILDGAEIFAFCTATTAAQALAFAQAVERLVQDNQAAYAQTVKELERRIHRRRPSSAQSLPAAVQARMTSKSEPSITIHTDVVVTLRSLSVGIFPANFSDRQLFSLDASDTRVRFAVLVEEGSRIHSTLDMTMGHFNVALAAISNPNPSRSAAELTVEEVVTTARSARGGTIVRVPKVVASMQTWHQAQSNLVDYIFKSSFEGKVDVGWNYSRIGFIRNMWDNHSRTLASRLGKPLPEAVVKITTDEPLVDDDGKTSTDRRKSQGKITAVVNVPQSRFTYTPLEPPIIETPQLRDMGEATPPLEWIGLHRDRLPNVTHQIILVPLLEVAKEVDQAYKKILGSS